MDNLATTNLDLPTNQTAIAAVLAVIAAMLLPLVRPEARLLCPAQRRCCRRTQEP